MSEFTEKDKELMLAALNFLLKNEANALQSAGVIVPLAAKVQAMTVAKQPEAAE